jgi:hypothetical protein
MSNKNYVEIKRSTISDANCYRISKVFEGLCCALINKQNRNVTEILKILDSTPIIISGRGSEWVLEKSTNRIKGLKVHVRISPQVGTIDQMIITAPNINDISIAKTWNIIPETINIFDKGYFDYNWWYKIHKANAYFVTRSKKNTSYKVIHEIPRKIDTPNTILKDQIIQLTNKHPRGGKVNLLTGLSLRLITYNDPIHKKTYKFLTNLLTVSAQEIADYYKIRWEVELFFKWLKQNLKIKSFLGANENAIKIQIYTAIITYILLKELQKFIQPIFSRTKDFLAWIKMIICAPIIFSWSKSENIPKNQPNFNYFNLGVDYESFA